VARIAIPDRKKKPARPRERGQAKDLRPGGYVNIGTGEVSKIRTINELCLAKPEPHVHVVTTGGESRCYGFGMMV
jgi:hypothetical protein